MDEPLELGVRLTEILAILLRMLFGAFLSRQGEDTDLSAAPEGYSYID